LLQDCIKVSSKGDEGAIDFAIAKGACPLLSDEHLVALRWQGTNDWVVLENTSADEANGAKHASLRYDNSGGWSAIEYQVYLGTANEQRSMEPDGILYTVVHESNTGRPLLSYSSSFADEMVRQLCTPKSIRVEDNAVECEFWPVTFHPGAGWTNWALGVRLELVVDGVVVATCDSVLLSVPDPGRLVTPGRGPRVAMRSMMEDALTTILGESDSGTLVVVGDPEAAAQDPRRAAYWTGRVEVPITLP
jgi:hypothetical protein